MRVRDARLPRQVAALLLGVAILHGPARADDHAWVQALWVGPAGGQPSLLSLPMSWQVGDAAVVLVSDPGAQVDQRDRLVGSLLEAGAAVLEVDARAARRSDAAAVVAAAGAALRQEAGAGLVAAVGLGLGGAPGALLASVHPGFVAHIGVLGSDMAFVAGAESAPPEERWPERVGSFCAAMASAIGTGPGPGEAGGAGGAEARQACARALAPQPAPAMAVSFPSR
jgi:hypothetical protein